MNKVSHYHLGIILAFLVTLLAAAGWVFTKVALYELDPIPFIAYRFILAALVLLPFCWRDLMAFNLDQWRRSCMLGVAMAIAICVWVEGMYQIEHIGEAAFIVSLMVIIIPIFSRFFGKAVPTYLLISWLPAVCGLYLLTGANGFNFEPAQLILLLSALGFSLHVVLSTEYTLELPAVALTSVQLFITGVIACVFSFFKGNLDQIFYEPLTLLTWTMLVCSALIATSLRFGLQTKAMSLISANETSTIFALGPVWTAGLGWLVLSESMTMLQFIGCALIFGAQIIYRLGQRISTKF